MSAAIPKAEMSNLEDANSTSHIGRNLAVYTQTGQLREGERLWHCEAAEAERGSREFARSC